MREWQAGTGRWGVWEQEGIDGMADRDEIGKSEHMVCHKAGMVMQQGKVGLGVVGSLCRFPLQIQPPSSQHSSPRSCPHPCMLPCHAISSQPQARQQKQDHTLCPLSSSPSSPSPSIISSPYKLLLSSRGGGRGRGKEWWGSYHTVLFREGRCSGGGKAEERGETIHPCPRPPSTLSL